MARPSSIERLPAEIRELIGRLRDGGRTIDEILGKLEELDVDVSRSALGRHVKQLDAIGEEIRRSRAVSEALVAKLGDAPESRTARLNIELMQSMVMKLLINEEGETVSLDGKEAMFIATSLQKLAQASKQDVERELKIREEAARKTKAAAVKAVEEATREKGLTKETAEAIRASILGVKVSQ